jgi:site-specific recombinase XerD
MNMHVPALAVAEESLPVALRVALEGAADLARAEKAPATKCAYGSDFAIFRAWCADQGLCALPAEPAAVAAFIAAEAARGIKCATLGRRVAGVRHAHKLAGLSSPTDDERVKAVMRGARRTLGVAPVKKSAATADKVLAMVAGSGRGLAGKRDRALLLLGFALAARRSELVALDVADLEECPEGLRVTIRRSKTDQEGAGAVVAVCRGAIACPVAAMKEWLTAAGITDGPVFRRVNKGGRLLPGQLRAQSVALIVKAFAARLGLDPGAFSGHSLRSGFLTSAAARGASLFKMMDVSRHKSVDVLRGYVRDADAFRDHAGAGLL